MVDAVISSP